MRSKSYLNETRRKWSIQLQIQVEWKNSMKAFCSGPKLRNEPYDEMFYTLPGKPYEFYLIMCVKIDQYIYNNLNW